MNYRERERAPKTSSDFAQSFAVGFDEWREDFSQNGGGESNKNLVQNQQLFAAAIFHFSIFSGAAEIFHEQINGQMS